MRTPLKLCLLVFISLSVIFPLKTQAQLVLGQYEDEAPFRTWNTFGLFTGAGLSTGGAHYARAFDLSASLTNPSQLSQLPSFTAVINGSLNQASFLKYSIINTGPAYTNENSSLVLYSLDFGGISLNLEGWAFSLSTSILENYDRPSAFFEYKERGSVIYALDFEQSGLLRNVNVSVSRTLGSLISVGLGLNWVIGNLDKKLEEEYYSGQIIMTDEKSYKWQNFYLNGGITVHLTSDLHLAGVFQTPYKRKSNSESLLRYQALPSGTDIKIESQDPSSFAQPLILGAGIHYRFSDRWSAAADATFFNWSSYKATFFGEERPRDLKNIVVLGTGIEYRNPVQIFGLETSVPLWLGFHYDPQPMKNPSSAYSYVTFGTGVDLDHFFLHAGAALGYETGTGDQLRGRRVVLTLGYKK